MINKNTSHRWVAAAALAVAILASPAVLAGNDCDPGEEPDVIVGAIFDRGRYGTSGGSTGFSIGTESCNIGTCTLQWHSGSPFHPVIAQNMYRLHEGRLQQIGVGWLKHGFSTLNNNLCGSCQPSDGQHLGVNCSDPYWASLNGNQSNLGPRFEVNAQTGVFLWPFTSRGQTSSNPNYKRISVKVDDLQPSQHPGALYFVEAQYVTQDDAAAGNHTNNNSYRQINPNSAGTDFSLTGPTFQQDPMMMAWESFGDGTVGWIDGELIGGYEIKDLGDGFFRYEYAIQNVISERNARAVQIRMPHGVTLRNVGFEDADYHSGEPFDDTDWTITHEDGAGVSNYLSWSTDDFMTNPNGNALRWGTTYNFYFEADVGPPGSGGPVVGSQKSVDVAYHNPKGGAPTTGWNVPAPDRCGDNYCDIDETSLNCAVDCAATLPSGEVQDGLIVSLQEGGDLALNWSPSCLGNDDDYGVYEGFIGSYSSHEPVSCTTGGSTSATFTPATESTYYLIVPNNGIAEGTGGYDSDGNTRSAGSSPCLQQEVGTCP